MSTYKRSLGSALIKSDCSETAMIAKLNTAPMIGSWCQNDAPSGLISERKNKMSNFGNLCVFTKNKIMIIINTKPKTKEGKEIW